MTYVGACEEVSALFSEKVDVEVLFVREIAVTLKNIGLTTFLLGCKATHTPTAVPFAPATRSAIPRSSPLVVTANSNVGDSRVHQVSQESMGERSIHCLPAITMRQHLNIQLED